MQPLPGTDTSLILGIKANAKTEIAVNSEEWWRQQINKIKPDEIFFHRYFVAKEEGDIKALGRKRKRGGDDEIDEDEIWEALVKSSKEEGGLGDVDVDGDDDESVDWSNEEFDDEIGDEMNEEPSDVEYGSDRDNDQDVNVEMSGDEGDVNAFFDDEADEVEDADDDDDKEIDEISDEDESASEGSDDDVDGRFEFGDSASDIMGSDEDIPISAQQTNADRSKKRKLKNLPTFASLEDYADMLND